VHDCIFRITQYHQLRVVLRGISPLIWRRLLVRSDTTLAHLHTILQIVCAWGDEHLHRFHIHGREYGSSMYHLSAADVAVAVDMAKAAPQVVFVDDAHMMARRVLYDEPAACGLGEMDVAVWSLDKHVPGPRGAAIVGRHDPMRPIMAQVFQRG
jgi:hypothetical protein